MADFKIVKIIGIHPREEYLRDVTPAAARKAWREAKADPNFVAGALFEGGHRAPLSGQSFFFVEAASRQKRKVRRG